MWKGTATEPPAGSDRGQAVRRRTAAAAALLAVLLAGSAASAAPYPPPATGQGKASPSRVKQGHCTSFSGDGFATPATIEIYDDSTHYGTTTSDDKGGFSSRVCFDTDARVGDHVLAARGPNAQTVPTDPADREVTANVTVVGVEQSSNGVDSSNAASTTPLASPFSLAVLGLLLLPLLSGLLLVLERRHRRRRRATA